MEPMHPVFTLVPERSYKAFVKGNLPTLDELMCALVVDPDEAQDVAKERKLRIPHALPVFADLGRAPYTAALQTIAQWIMQQPIDGAPLDLLARYDRRLLAWIACQVARESLRFAHDYEEKLLVILQKTERWVTGNLPSSKTQKTASEAYGIFTLASNSPSDADTAETAYASYAVYAAAASPSMFSGIDAEAVVFSAASAWASGETKVDLNNDDLSPSQLSAWTSARDAELVRLRGVAAEACMTFPG